LFGEELLYKVKVKIVGAIEPVFVELMKLMKMEDGK
jgi:hypothetical protein